MKIVNKFCTDNTATNKSDEYSILIDCWFFPFHGNLKKCCSRNEVKKLIFRIVKYEIICCL